MVCVSPAVHWAELSQEPAGSRSRGPGRDTLQHTRSSHTASTAPPSTDSWGTGSLNTHIFKCLYIMQLFPFNTLSCLCPSGWYPGKHMLSCQFLDWKYITFIHRECVLTWIGVFCLYVQYQSDHTGHRFCKGKLKTEQLLTIIHILMMENNDVHLLKYCNTARQLTTLYVVCKVLRVGSNIKMLLAC